MRLCTGDRSKEYFCPPAHRNTKSIPLGWSIVLKTTKDTKCTKISFGLRWQAICRTCGCNQTGKRPSNEQGENEQWRLGVRIVLIGGLHLKPRIRLVIVIVMLLELGDLVILTFLIMNLVSRASILKQPGLPLGTTTVAGSGRKKKNEEVLVWPSITPITLPG
jgi:hypothetical protein